MAEWASASIGDFFDLDPGYAFKSPEFVDAGIPVIKIKNIKAGYFSEHEFSYVSPRFLSLRANKLAKPGDLLISMSGNRHDGSPDTWVGKIAIFKRAEAFFINQRVGALRRKAGAKIDLRFASFLLSSFPYQELFISIATSSGGQANLSPQQILSAPLSYPPLDTQIAIGELLGALDDKIELNRHLSKTLQAAARAIFKDWFVDFGPTRAKMEGRAPYLAPEIWRLFPDRVDDEGIPELWKRGILGDHVLNFDSKRVPVSSAERAKRRGSYPYHGATGVMDYIDDYLFDGTYLLVGEDGSVVKQDGLAYTQYVSGKTWVNNHAHVLQGKGSVSTEQLLLYFQHEPVAPYITGAVQLKLSQGRMNSMPFTFAGEQLCQAFAEEVTPLYERLRCNVDEVETLAAIRDLLLPKLMSGEIRVSETGIFVKKAMHG